MEKNTQTLIINIIRNVLAVLVGLYIGANLNMYLIKWISPLFELPEGTNPIDFKSLKAHMHLFNWKNFIAPFVAHAGGTLIAAFICTLLAASRKWILALIIGFVFLLGGIYMVKLLPEAPLWFDVLDLVMAYIPMAFLGLLLGEKIVKLVVKKQ
ncbi:MAG: hypothetical protein LRY27_01665 [Chitinophagales bacterium]|nr:hypothetical protein [Chitinophagales bacterium]